MSVQQQVAPTSVSINPALLNTSNTSLLDQAPPMVASNAANTSFNLGGFGGNSNVEEPAPTDYAPGEGEQLPSPWISESSLVISEIPLDGDVEPVCFFEPLQYCKPGRLLCGFCEFHTTYMFNVTLATCGILTRASNDKIIHTKMLRRFVKYPTKFQPSLLNMMPVPELCESIEEYESYLRLDLFAHSLALKNHDDKRRTDRTVAVHKAYLVRALRLYTPSGNTQHRNDDSVIAYTVGNWLKYCASELLRIRYDGKLVFVTPEQNESEIRYISLNKCSIFTQMICLLYDTPYVQSPALGYKWLSSPAAVVVYNGKTFVLDCTKASHGTAMHLGAPTFGDPATLSYFRLDKNANILILEERYSPAREICFSTNINTDALIGINPQMSIKNQPFLKEDV